MSDTRPQHVSPSTAMGSTSRRNGRAWVTQMVAGGLAVMTGVATVGLTVGRTRSSIPPLPANATPLRDVPTARMVRDFVTSDSIVLAGHQQAADSRGTVILLHGLGEHDSVFVRWAPALMAATTMNVVGVSLRGNGASRDTLHQGDPARRYLADLSEIVRELQRRNPSGPVILCGVGGGVALASAYTLSDAGLAPISGVIALLDSMTIERAVGNGRATQWRTTRLATLRVLRAMRVPWVDGLAVASQDPTYRAPATAWSYRAISIMTPRLPDVVRQPVPLLVIGRIPPTQYDTSDTRSWHTVRVRPDLADSTVQHAITRWSARFAADAFQPIPPRPTQALPVLPGR